jgi:AmmeMemoRadiSam system protein B
MAAAQPIEKIRPPAVAGSFYPADPDGLRAQVADLMAAAPAYTGPPPTALIAPHAGYVYSGAVAAAAFAGLRDSAPTALRVVVIGPAHYVAVRGIVVPTANAFETPLGRVPVAHGALATIADLRDVHVHDAAHAPEHALEVELPFLQTLLGSFVLVPLLVGAADPRDVSEIFERLWDEPETLIVVSSDLSHFLEYDAAKRRDAETAAAIERLDWTALGPGDACGALPIAGLLKLVKERGLTARRLALCNSGDTAGSRDSVVGYGAWAFAA